jgi:ankyrin repeat protein
MTYNGNPEVIETLASLSNDVNYCSASGSSAMKVAVLRPDSEIVEAILLKAGAKPLEDAAPISSECTSEEAAEIVYCPDESGAAPLIHAVADGADVGVIRAILAAGSDVSAVGPLGRTALIWAASEESNLEVVKALLEAGADVNANDGEALSVAAWEHSLPEMIELLLAAGADVHAGEDDNGQTPLAYAAMTASDPHVIRMLLDAGSNVHVRYEGGYTVLMLAAGDNRNPEIVRMLANAGVDINAVKQPEGWTALMIAAQACKSRGIIDTLLDAGADGTLRCADGKTAFDYVKVRKWLKGTNAYWRLRDAKYKSYSDSTD